MKKLITLAAIITVTFGLLSCMIYKGKPKTPQSVPVYNIKIDENFNMNTRVDYKIDSAKIVGDTLELTVTFKKTKGTHIFELIGNRKYMKSNPMKLQIYLKHMSGGETSEKNDSRKLRFNIAAIKPDFDAGNMMYIVLPGHETKVEYKLK